MGKVSTGFSMSLDGFVAGPNDDVQHVFKWYTSGDTDLHFPGTDMAFKVSPASVQVFEEAFGTVGALVTGRRLFDHTHAWGGKHPMNVPVIVVTHTVPQEWVKEGSPFTFVMDGVESAVRQAKTMAGEKDVAIASPTILQQCIRAGLLDEIHIDLVPVLLGAGIRLFDQMGTGPIELEQVRVVEGMGVTHLTYRVVKEKQSHRGEK